MKSAGGSGQKTLTWSEPYHGVSHARLSVFSSPNRPYYATIVQYPTSVELTIWSFDNVFQAEPRGFWGKSRLIDAHKFIEQQEKLLCQ